MGYRIRAYGTATFMIQDEELQILAGSLKQAGTVQTSSSRFKEDTENWLATFVASTEYGDFSWEVSYSESLNGISVLSSELIASPSEAEMITDLDFEVMHDEDEYER